MCLASSKSSPLIWTMRAILNLFEKRFHLLKWSLCTFERVKLCKSTWVPSPFLFSQTVLPFIWVIYWVCHRYSRLFDRTFNIDLSLDETTKDNSGCKSNEEHKQSVSLGELTRMRVNACACYRVHGRALGLALNWKWGSTQRLLLWRSVWSFGNRLDAYWAANQPITVNQTLLQSQIGVNKLATLLPNTVRFCQFSWKSANDEI